MIARLSGLLMIACMLSLGSGALQFLHELQHAAEDAREDAIAAAANAAAGKVGQPPAEHHHDETNCQICAQLHMALSPATPPLPLVWLGILLVILALLPERRVSTLAPSRISCRGPPVG